MWLYNLEKSFIHFQMHTFQLCDGYLFLGNCVLSTSFRNYLSLLLENYLILCILRWGCCLSVVLYCDVMWCVGVLLFSMWLFCFVCLCVAFQYLKRGSFFPLDYSHPLAHLSLQIKPYSITVNAGALWTKLALISSFT